MLAAVLAQVCWPAARTNLPGSPLTLVSLPGSQLVGLLVGVNTVGLGSPESCGSPATAMKGSLFFLHFGVGLSAPVEW